MAVSVNVGSVFSRLIVHERQVIVDDHVYLLNVNSTGNDVRGD
jgi:hypothetical protein